MLSVLAMLRVVWLAAGDVSAWRQPLLFIHMLHCVSQQRPHARVTLAVARARGSVMEKIDQNDLAIMKDPVASLGSLGGGSLQPVDRWHWMPAPSPLRHEGASVIAITCTVTMPENEANSIERVFIRRNVRNDVRLFLPMVSNFNLYRNGLWDTPSCVTSQEFYF